MSAIRAPVPLLARHARVFRPHAPVQPLYRTTTRSVHSALMNLAGLSSSRESQHFSKERKVPRIEYSSQLQLIRSSEVDPFDAPGSSPLAPGRNPAVVSTGSMPALSVVAFQSILKELEVKKQEVHILNKALDQLSARYSARNRDARNLSWIVLVLAFGFVFPGWLREPTQGFAAWVSEMLNAGVLSTSQTPPASVPAQAPPQNLRRDIVGVRSKSRDALRVDPSPSIPLDHSTPQRSWSRIFWASPT